MSQPPPHPKASPGALRGLRLPDVVKMGWRWWWKQLLCKMVSQCDAMMSWCLNDVIVQAGSYFSGRE